MEIEKRFCAQCRYLTGDMALAYCEHPSNGRNLVTGKVEWKHAATNRELSGPCGPDAKLFEPNPPPTCWQKHGVELFVSILLVVYLAVKFGPWG